MTSILHPSPKRCDSFSHALRKESEKYAQSSERPLRMPNVSLFHGKAMVTSETLLRTSWDTLRSDSKFVNKDSDVVQYKSGTRMGPLKLHHITNQYEKCHLLR